MASWLRSFAASFAAASALSSISALGCLPPIKRITNVKGNTGRGMESKLLSIYLSIYLSISIYSFAASFAAASARSSISAFGCLPPKTKNITCKGCDLLIF